MSDSYADQAARWKADRDEQLSRATLYEPGPFVPGSYSVGRRDTYHFDIFAPRRPGYVIWYYQQNPGGIAYPMKDGASERAFAVRGDPGDIYIWDERWNPAIPRPRESIHFPSVESAMAWISATLLVKECANERPTVAHG